MKKLKLPNFLIVGAAKSGTSSLHNYLNQHPDVFMPTYIEGLKVKEPRFLISKMVKDRLHAGVWTFDEYKKLIKEASNYTAGGEATVLYLYYYENNHRIYQQQHKLGLMRHIRYILHLDL